MLEKFVNSLGKKILEQTYKMHTKCVYLEKYVAIFVHI